MFWTMEKLYIHNIQANICNTGIVPTNMIYSFTSKFMYYVN